ncbi:unnamed protein product [Effrenium voratum]|uniref:Uncharacterized protein n=1 Tax=Effrenium voratum TaxID=2562239 RepID=A0AA36I1R0_9DINO|nr:unnamed protein product [Effrenium voratum]
MDGEDDAQEEEFEVEDILRYRKNEDGSEQFLVKWQGFSEEESTWEPLAHMNDNCRELIAKARALFAYRRRGPNGDASGAGEVAVSSASPNTAATAEASAPSIAVIEEDKEDAQAGQPGLEEAAVGQEEEEEEEEEDTEAEEANGAAQKAPSPAGEEEISIIEDDEPPVASAPPSKRPVDLGFVGAPSDPRMKRPRLIPPSEAAPGAWDGAVPSQAKVPAGSGPATNGVRHVPSSVPAKPSTPPSPAGQPEVQIPEPPKPPPSRDIKCLCGALETISPNSRPGLVACRVCNCSLHTACVTGVLQKSVPANFVCPPCRLERVDEFHPTVGSGLLKHSYATSTTTFSLTFSAQAALWKKQCWAVHLRSVHIHGSDLSGPAWPHKVQGKLNGRQCVAIDPPKHLHVRREQCYNLTPLLKQGLNTLELRFFPRPDKPKDEPEENYCVGVVLTRPRSVSSIISRIRARSQETVSSGRARVERLLAQVARMEAGQEDECAVTGNFGRTLKPLCPVSHCPIEEAAIGRECHHIQVFDLNSYIAVNQRMRSLDKRWTCPVCGGALRPDDVVLHPFAQGILDTLRGEEENVEAIVFNEDCSWSTISAVKDEKRGTEGEEEGARAEMIDLSDSD